MHDSDGDNDILLNAVSTLSGERTKLTRASENGKINVRFSGNLLKQPKIYYNHGKVINVYATYKLRNRTVNNPDCTVQNAFFGAAKDINTNHYKYSGYGIWYDSGSSFSFGNNINAKDVIIFGCDMSFSSYANNRANNIYVLGTNLTQGANGKTIYVEKLYNLDFTQQDKRFVLSLHYNGDDSYLFVNGTEQLKFKAKGSGLNRNLLCSGNIVQIGPYKI